MPGGDVVRNLTFEHLWAGNGAGDAIRPESAGYTCRLKRKPRKQSFATTRRKVGSIPIWRRATNSQPT